MLEKEVAVQIKERSLNAVRELISLLHEIRDNCDEEDMAVIKRGIGLTIGRIQLEILDYVYYQHPDLSDLND